MFKYFRPPALSWQAACGRQRRSDSCAVWKCGMRGRSHAGCHLQSVALRTPAGDYGSPFLELSKLWSPRRSRAGDLGMSTPCEREHGAGASKCAASVSPASTLAPCVHLCASRRREIVSDSQLRQLQDIYSQLGAMTCSTSRDMTPPATFRLCSAQPVQRVLPQPVPVLPSPPAHYHHPLPPSPQHAPPPPHHIQPVTPTPAPNRDHPVRPALRLQPVPMKTDPVPTPGAKPTLFCDGHDSTGENRNRKFGRGRVADATLEPCQFYMTKRRWRCAFCRLYSPYRTHDGYEGKHSWA